MTGTFFDTYNKPGHGFLEGVDEARLAVRPGECGLAVERQASIEVRFHRCIVGCFRGDLLLENRPRVEGKAGCSLLAAHEAQSLDSLKATGFPLGPCLESAPRAKFRHRVFS